MCLKIHAPVITAEGGAALGVHSLCCLTVSPIRSNSDTMVTNCLAKIQSEGERVNATKRYKLIFLKNIYIYAHLHVIYSTLIIYRFFLDLSTLLSYYKK